jgi:hypothetical protein
VGLSSDSGPTVLGALPLPVGPDQKKLAQAIAACDEEPSVVLSAKEKLFEEKTYERLFRRENVSFYLTRYWLQRTTARQVKGSGPEIAYMKFFVTHSLWNRNGKVLTKFADLFIAQAEGSFGGADHESLSELETSIDKTFDAVNRFYRKTKTKDDTVYSFFKRQRQYEAFLAFMEEPKQVALRSKIDKADDLLAAGFAP